MFCVNYCFVFLFLFKEMYYLRIDNVNVSSFLCLYRKQWMLLHK